MRHLQPTDTMTTPPRGPQPDPEHIARILAANPDPGRCPGCGDLWLNDPEHPRWHNCTKTGKRHEVVRLTEAESYPAQVGPAELGQLVRELLGDETADYIAILLRRRLAEIRRARHG